MPYTCACRKSAVLLLCTILTSFFAASGQQPKRLSSAPAVHKAAPPPVVELRDLSGRWEGYYSITGKSARVMLFLQKISPGVYSGIQNLSWRDNTDQTTPYGDAKLTNETKIILARFDGAVLHYDEIDTVLYPNSEFGLNLDAHLDFHDSSGSLLLKALNPSHNPSTETPAHFWCKRVSGDIPGYYVPRFLGQPRLQISQFVYYRTRPANFRYNTGFGPEDGGYIGFNIQNSEPVFFHNLTARLYRVEKAKDGGRRVTPVDNGDPLPVAIGPNWTTRYAVNVGSELQLLGDSIRFMVVVSAVDIPLATGEVSMPVPILALGRALPSDSAYDVAHDNPFIGDWKIVSQSGKPLPLLMGNTLVEMESKGVGIARNEHGNTAKNVKFFNWESNFTDSIWLVAPHGLHWAYYFRSGFHTITLRRQEAGTNSEIVLQQVSDNAYDLYEKRFPVNPGEASRWIKFIPIHTNNKFDFGEDGYCDIYPINQHFGEIINYTGSTSLDTISFIKYELTKNPNSAANTETPGLFSSVVPGTDPQNYWYTCRYLNSARAGIVDCLLSDGIIILNSETLGESYLVKSGPPHWGDLVALHKQYNAHMGKPLLPPYGVHWQVCPRCGGNGKVVLGQEKVYTSRDLEHQYYYNRDIRQTCGSCEGKGGWYADDKTLKTVDVP